MKKEQKTFLIKKNTSSHTFDNFEMRGWEMWDGYQTEIQGKILEKNYFFL